MDWLWSIGSWLLIGVGIVVLWGVVYGLGTLGLTVRRGVALRKALHDARKEGAQAGTVPTAKWFALNRQATLMIGVPILATAAISAVLLLLLPMETFRWTLLGWLAPGLGYFGLRFGPGGDFL